MTERILDRQTAGKLLARKLLAYADSADVLVLGLPRGGVAVAFEIAKALHLPLDIFLVRKLGVPEYEELAMGAVATGGVKIVDTGMVAEFQLEEDEIDSVVKAEQKELRRREAIYRLARPVPDFHGQTVILVDDGLATGSTMRAAVEGVKRLGAGRIIVAAGVAPLSTSLLLGSEADEVVCLLTPRDFRAVGEFYEDFRQVSDHDVCSLLDEAWHGDDAPSWARMSARGT